MRLHARVIVRDGSRAFIGSQSLRRPELEQRREVGILISNPSVARKMREVFEQDWIGLGHAQGRGSVRRAGVAEGGKGEPEEAPEAQVRTTLVRSRKSA